MLNMEALAAAAAARMVGKDADASEKLITQSLMVLAEQGVYALGLFLNTRGKKLEKLAGLVSNGVAGLLDEAGLMNRPGENAPTLAYYQALTGADDNESDAEALQRLLLSKSLIETALTYARYHAKSMA